MRELFGRIAELDLTASEDLLVIDYFDRLAAARLSTEAMLKEAAILARAAVGYEAGTRIYRRLANGDVGAVGPLAGEVLRASVAENRAVWMETDANSSASAPMILERLALVLSLDLETPTEGSPSAVEILLAPRLVGEPEHERAVALARLRLERSSPMRAVALPLTVTPPAAWPSALIDTPWGTVRGAIARDGFVLDRSGGVGTIADAMHLDVSWRHALLALRLSDGTGPTAADDLGALLLGLEAEDASEIGRREVSRIDRALEKRWTLTELHGVADGLSLRALAEASGLHHSTIQSRLARVETDLGYDATTPAGRHRLAFGLLLHRLHHYRAFDRPSL